MYFSKVSYYWPLQMIQLSAKWSHNHFVCPNHLTRYGESMSVSILFAIFLRFYSPHSGLRNSKTTGTIYSSSIQFWQYLQGLQKKYIQKSLNLTNYSQLDEKSNVVKSFNIFPQSPNLSSQQLFCLIQIKKNIFKMKKINKKSQNFLSK